MALKVGQGEFSGNYERPEAGSIHGRCYGMVDLGTHDNTHPKAAPGATKQEVMLFFELSGDKMEDGRPFVVNKRYTAVLSDRSILYKDLNAWRGKPFTADELAGFDLTKVLGAPALLNLVEKPNKDPQKSPYINIASISPPMKGFTVEELHNEQFAFDIDEDLHNVEKLKKVYKWVRNILRESKEAKQAAADGNPMPSEEVIDPEKAGGDDPSNNGQTEQKAGEGDDTIPF